MLVSIDNGRSASKIFMEDGKTLRVPSVYGFVSKDLLETTLVKRNELIVSIPGFKDNQMMVVGRSALDRLKSDQIIESSEVSEFLKNCIIFNLATLTELCPRDSDIELILQLTYNDITKYGKALKKAMDGVKKVTRYDSFGNELKTYTYNITSSVYLQGLCSYFSLLFKEDGSVDNDIKSGTTLVVDIGHRTTDIALVKSLSVAATASSDIGAGSIFFAVSDELKKGGLNMPSKEIEWKFLEEKYEVKSRTEKFNIKTMMESQAQRIAQRLTDYVLREFAYESIDTVILTGGSAHLFLEEFQKAFPFAEQPDNAQFSNAKGALYWRLYKENLENM